MKLLSDKKHKELLDTIATWQMLAARAADGIAALKQGHANYEVTIKNMTDYVESFNEEIRNKDEMAERRHRELRIARRRLELIDGVITSLDSDTRFSRRIAEILGAEITISDEKPTVIDDQDQPSPTH